MRLYAIKSKQCAVKANKLYCPEVFLDAVADKLTSTTDLFLDAELLSKFYYSVSFAKAEWYFLLRLTFMLIMFIVSSRARRTIRPRSLTK